MEELLLSLGFLDKILGFSKSKHLLLILLRAALGEKNTSVVQSLSVKGSGEPEQWTGGDTCSQAEWRHQRWFLSWYKDSTSYAQASGKQKKYKNGYFFFFCGCQETLLSSLVPMMQALYRPLWMTALVWSCIPIWHLIWTLLLRLQSTHCQATLVPMICLQLCWRANTPICVC